MQDHPRIVTMKRGGHYRRVALVQPYIGERGGYAQSVYRVGFMGTAIIGWE